MGLVIKLGQGQESKILVEKHILGEGRARGELGELALGSPKGASTFWTRELSELRAICLGSPWARFGLVLKNPEGLAGLGRAAWASCLGRPWGDLLELALVGDNLVLAWEQSDLEASCLRSPWGRLGAGSSALCFFLAPFIVNG
ncbi:hypothetical protein LWI29_003893 [Acer saccharum]|uniref:Uncharacterized protein n=1 Tax=Acer saccharum TaxID=4024 RepID=A0AA39TMM6_ACESA|nr:hypothetical protein LWI29_003893 [Acer saccharum]